MRLKQGGQSKIFYFSRGADKRPEDAAAESVAQRSTSPVVYPEASVSKKWEFFSCFAQGRKSLKRHRSLLRRDLPKFEGAEPTAATNEILRFAPPTKSEGADLPKSLDLRAPTDGGHQSVAEECTPRNAQSSEIAVVRSFPKLPLR